MMNKILSINNSENKSGGWLIVPLTLWIIIPCIVILFILCDPHLKFSSIILMAAILIISIGFSCYLLDELLWQFNGKEIISYTNDCLNIEHSHRLFKVHQKIQWEEFLQASKYHSRFILISYLSLSGTSQYTISISTKDKRRIDCGVNLTNDQRDALIREINELHGLFCNSSQKQ